MLIFHIVTALVLVGLAMALFYSLSFANRVLAGELAALEEERDELKDRLLNYQLRVKELVESNQVEWRYGDDRCAACLANNWSACGHLNT